MGKTNKTLFPVLVIVFSLVITGFPLCGGGSLYAQTGQEARDEKKEVPVDGVKDSNLPGKGLEKPEVPVKKDNESPATDLPVKAAEKKIEKSEKAKREPAAKKNPDPALKNQPVDEGILLIHEGPFKYQRIPGYKAPEAGKVRDDAVKEKEERDAKKEDGSKKDTGGLFGFSKSTTDLVAKTVLAGIILLIFILYRIRTKNRRSSVLKRFPKA